MNILGLSAYYHDSAACLVRDGEIIAAAQEERFTRKKHDAAFPTQATRYCLDAGGVEPGKLDAIVFYDKPLTKFGRLLETYQACAPRGIGSFLLAMPQWIKQKLHIPYEIEREMAAIGHDAPIETFFIPHHLSHAASAFYPSPFESAAVLTIDGVGEWATSSIGVGRGASLELLHELRFPHSLGLLYSAFTFFCGFKVNSGEYKLMGLAPYGQPRFVDRIYEHLIDLRDDGSFRMDARYFDYMAGLKMTSDVFARLFEGPPRAPESRITQREMDLAASVQVVTEEIVLRMARYAIAVTGERRVCLAGGVALNCVANGRLIRERIADELWVQPASGDAGGALGAALYGWHAIKKSPRTARPGDSMKGSYLGPSFGNDEIRTWLDAQGHPYEKLDDGPARASRVAELLASENVVGVMLGRMEFGPRALGHRSILGDARSAKMQSVMNLKVKFRESFRPFAPAVLREDASQFFDLDVESPYMLVVAPVAASQRVAAEVGPSQATDDLLARVNQVRSTLPAITHVDNSARIQTVDAERSPAFYDILRAFKERTSTGVLINTSFNVRGEPIVCTPQDAYRCFMRSEMDYLLLENYLLARTAQPALPDDAKWREEFALD